MSYKTKSAAKAQLTRQLKNGQAEAGKKYEVYGCVATGFDFRADNTVSKGWFIGSASENTNNQNNKRK